MALRTFIVLAIVLIENVVQTSVVVWEVFVEIFYGIFHHRNNIDYLLLVVKGYLPIFILLSIGCVSQQSIKQNYIANNPGLSGREVSAIQNNRIFVGMPADSVRASWGEPFDVIQGTAAYGNSQTWYYKYFYQYWRTKAIVYFIQDENGIYRVYDITQLSR